MSKGAVLDEAFISVIGLAEQLMTLTGNMENKHHEVLQEPMFHIKTAEIEETIFLDRKYVFDNQVSVKSTYGKDSKILLWVQRVLRQNPLTPGSPPLDLLMARDIFLLGDWREFQRFKQFVKSMRILDAQARNFLAEHHAEFSTMATDAEAMAKLLGYLGHIADWPDLEGGDKSGTLEIVAKTYSKDLVSVRSSPYLAKLLMRYDPDLRFNLFRLFSFVEDAKGANTLVQFLQAMAAATRQDEVVQACHEMRSSRDLQRGFAALRHALLSPMVK